MQLKVAGKLCHDPCMDTARVDITYRPLRIAWVIMPGDIESFRQVVRQSCTLAGGRYNPSIFADSDDAAAKIDCFGVDFLMPVGNAP
ncbi:MAG: hypothetical protein Q7U14_00700, partial [Lacisediminimonas sp.]|nr:hypothetical protein [Lacisediminimonas sp.]